MYQMVNIIETINRLLKLGGSKIKILNNLRNRISQQPSSDKLINQYSLINKRMPNDKKIAFITCDITGNSATSHKQNRQESDANRRC